MFNRVARRMRRKIFGGLMKSIKAKLILATSVMILAAILMVAIPTLTNQDYVLKQNVMESATNHISATADSINSFLDKPKTIVKDIAFYVTRAELDLEQTQKDFDDMEEQHTGSQQIVSALKIMNDSTLEVKNASHEMADGNRAILTEIKNLQDATTVIKDEMNEMAVGASEMNKTGTLLSEISSKVRESINRMGNHIDRFKV